MSGRYRLDDRRHSHNLSFLFHGETCTVTWSCFPSGAIAELFLTHGKPNSDREIAAHDSAILASLCLQFGVPLSTIRHALLESDDGTAAGALAHAIDLIDAMAYAQ